MRMLCMARRKALVRAIRLQIGDKVEVVGDDAGMHLVMMLPSGVNDVVVSKRAAQKGVSAMPLSTCYLRPPDRGGLILGYGGANPRQIQEGVAKLRMSIDG
jgi:GntR family transcriptional regulator/MocR family aminotransferase